MSRNGERGGIMNGKRPYMDYRQYRAACRLVHECCNYDNGNCIALDNGDGLLYCGSCRQPKEAYFPDSLVSAVMISFPCIFFMIASRSLAWYSSWKMSSGPTSLLQ